jgi:1-acyl-sn-glycerol-3-phosphate acyltransferase
VKFNIADFALTDEEKGKIEGLFSEYAPLKHDAWGASLDAILTVAPAIKFLYEKYFRVSLNGIEKIPDTAAIFVANHGGQIPIDGMMVVYSLLTKASKSRLTRAMADRWVPSLPFIGSFFMKVGQVVGEQKNCSILLQNGQSVLVFPEGVKGSGKTFDQRYHLQNFGSGFFRLALENKVPIVPVTLVGTEETYPAIHNAKTFAKLMGIPYFPITPSFPLLGPLGMIPLPTRISIKFLDPIYPTLAADASDKEVGAEIAKIHSAMQRSLHEGLDKRGSNFFTGEAF